MIKQLQMDDAVQLTDNISEADALLALHSKLKKNSGIQAAAKSHDIPIYVTKVSENYFHSLISSLLLIVINVFMTVFSGFPFRQAHWCR